METNKNANIYCVYLIKILNETIHIIDKFEINSKKIQTINELKYFIIEKYKKNKFCPCQLIISEYLEYGFFCSNLNETPEKNIDECFPSQKIYINVNSDNNCDCGFSNLNDLSKFEIYENFMKKIRQLILKYEIKINEKEKQIKELEEINDELLNNIDNRIKKNKEMNFPSSTPDNVVKLNQYDDNIKFEDFYDVIIK